MSEQQETEDYEPLLPDQRKFKAKVKANPGHGGKRKNAGGKKGATKERTRGRNAQGAKLVREKFPELGAKDARQWLGELNKFGMWEYYILHRDVNISLRAWLYLNDRAYGKPFVAVNPDMLEGAGVAPSDDPRMQALMQALQNSKPSSVTVTKTQVELSPSQPLPTPDNTVVLPASEPVTITSPYLPVSEQSQPSTQKPPTHEVSVHSSPNFFQKVNDQKGEGWGEEDWGWEGKEGREETEEDIRELRRKARMFDLMQEEKNAGGRGRSKIRTKELEPEVGDGEGMATSKPGRPQKGANEREEAL